MTASIIPFPSRGPTAGQYARELLPTNLRRKQAGAVGITSQRKGQNNPACKIVVRGLKLRIPPTSPLTPAGRLAGEEAAICANLTGLFLDARGIGRALNFCRPFGRPATLLRALQACKQSARGISETFQVFLRWLVGFHADEHDSGVTQNVGTIDQRRGFFSQGGGCV